jgi:GxxExxY protein
MKLEHMTGQIIAGAIKVHSALGPGLLENAYKLCLAHELRTRGLHVELERPIPISYNGIVIDVSYRADLLVERQVLVETKAVRSFLTLFRAQLVSQLRMGKFPVGLIINFHVERLKDGILRVVI